MSDDSLLDLNAPSPTTTKTAPQHEVVDDLVLTPPAAVAKVPTEKASAMMPLDSGTSSQLADRARRFVDGLVEQDPRAPEFQKKVNDIIKMGNKDIREASAVSNRMLDRPVRALEAARGSGNDAEAQKIVSNGLLELRRTVEDLDPSGLKPNEPRKLLGFIPFGKTVMNYFDKYASSQSHLNGIIKSLENGQDELRKDNAAIEGEKVRLWNTMQRLQEYAVLSESIDSALEEKIEDIAISDQEKADALKADLLFAVRQKHQDLVTQLAVSAQGYLALDMVRRNNLELIKGVERATTTTVSALRTAITVAQALANQKLVLDQITALNTTTSNIIVSTSQMLKQQSGEIHNQAASATVPVESLREAFNNIYATMDAIDTFKIQAVDNMANTVDALKGELARADEYIGRSREREGYDVELGEG